jgi:hypothetical protein
MGDYLSNRVLLAFPVTLRLGEVNVRRWVACRRMEGETPRPRHKKNTKYLVIQRVKTPINQLTQSVTLSINDEAPYLDWNAYLNLLTYQASYLTVTLQRPIKQKR